MYVYYRYYVEQGVSIDACEQLSLSATILISAQHHVVGFPSAFIWYGTRQDALYVSPGHFVGTHCIPALQAVDNHRFGDIPSTAAPPRPYVPGTDPISMERDTLAIRHTCDSKRHPSMRTLALRNVVQYDEV